MFKFANALILILMLCLSGFAQEASTQEKPGDKKAAEKKLDEAKKADIIKMLKLTGADKNAMMVVNNMIAMQKNANPSIPAEFWDEFKEEFDGSDLIKLTVPSWAKHYTHAEIKELIKFYESPIGKKMIAVQPKIMQESMMAGQKWGMEIGRKIAERINNADF